MDSETHDGEGFQIVRRGNRVYYRIFGEPVQSTVYEVRAQGVHEYNSRVLAADEQKLRAYRSIKGMVGLISDGGYVYIWYGDHWAALVPWVGAWK